MTNTSTTTNTTATIGESRIHHIGDIKQLQLLMDNWADGVADKPISYEVHGGPDACKKLCHQQLPEQAVHHQQQLLPSGHYYLGGGTLLIPWNQ